MRFFQKIAEGVDTTPLLHTLQRKPELWNAHRFRTTFTNTPHGQVDDIMLRYAAPDRLTDPDNTQPVYDEQACVFYPAWQELPQVRPIVLDLMRRVSAYELSRVLITRLHPGARILPHADKGGAYTDAPDVARYHICLQGLPGSLYRTGDEVVNMRTGEVWWFNALVEHEVQNNSADDRIHLLVDVRTF